MIVEEFFREMWNDCRPTFPILPRTRRSWTAYCQFNRAAALFFAAQQINTLVYVVRGEKRHYFCKKETEWELIIIN